MEDRLPPLAALHRAPRPMNPSPRPRLRVFILPGAPDCANLGDLAMLQVAIERLRGLWPEARLHVVTRDSEVLHRHCPEVESVPWKGRNRWLRIRALPRALFPNLPERCCRALPLAAARSWRLGVLLWPEQRRLVQAFADALFSADLIVLSGCGLLTDAFAHNAIQMLDTLAAAQRCGIPTVLLSQGIGPITRPDLLRRTSEVLPRVESIFLRERRTSAPLLKQLRVSESRIAVTGDDTVELAFRQRRAEIGRQIGVSLRLANYSAMTPDLVAVGRRVLADKAREFQTRLVGIPIRSGPVDSDIQALDRLLNNPLVAGDIGHDLHTPLDVIRRTSDCRLVVTGSYHAGVFALAQGIPVVAFAASDYYRDKFLGLADQFGAGCRVLGTHEPEFTSQLDRTIEEIWKQAPVLRPALLNAAEAQIKAARAAYQQLPALLSPRA